PLRSPSGRLGGTMRGQARVLGKPVRAPATRNPVGILRKTPEREKYSQACAWIAACELEVGIAEVSADSERLELAMQGRTLHADELRCARDIAGEPADLSDQIIAFEHFPC